MKNRRRKPQSAKRPASASKTTAETIQLTLESVAFGGDALARHEGKVYFVADALPGETVVAEVYQNKDRFAKARVVQRLTPPSYAVPAPCPYADRCGGCQWQSVPYPMQEQWKAGFIENALQRIGGIPAGTYSFRMQSSPETLHYRNRIEVKWEVGPEGSVRLGYFAKGSHELVAIESCWIADERINAVLQDCLQLRFPRRERSFQTSLEFQVIADGRVLVSGTDVPESFWQDFQAAVQEHAELPRKLVLDHAGYDAVSDVDSINYTLNVDPYTNLVTAPVVGPLAP